MKKSALKRTMTNLIKYYGFSYDYENESQPKPWEFRKDYDRANHLEEQRIFAPEVEPEHFLKMIKEEIEVRVRITKNEIFKIGELLFLAKKMCQQNGIGFQEWIKENFDFSYETANNMMLVFRNCFALRNVAMKIPSTILYKIAKPSFPKELKDYLFADGNLEEMTNIKLDNLLKKYREKGLDGIDHEITELNRSFYVRRQIGYTFDLFKNSLSILHDLKNNHEKIITKSSDYSTQIEWQEKEAQKINQKLYNTLTDAIDKMDKALEEATTMANKYFEEVEKKM